jgi:hypothetical protein
LQRIAHHPSHEPPVRRAEASRQLVEASLKGSQAVLARVRTAVGSLAWVLDRIGA